ncbi:hypothetical protein [Megasphaera vaginalis (ex Bordigoni et al. 2020)]|nr:hypothetical protein [Megasphaera vaginalis (ex Bordigoni et al. 2020)]
MSCVFAGEGFTKDLQGFSGELSWFPLVYAPCVSSCLLPTAAVRFFLLL